MVRSRGTPREERVSRNGNFNVNVNVTPERPVLLSQPLVDVTYFARDRLMHVVLCACERASSRPL